MNRSWLTNNPQAAAALKAADAWYAAKMRDCAGMKLADKIVAIRAARIALATTQEAIAARYQSGMTGEQAYEADRAQLPLYHNGTPRPCWADLPDYAQGTWNRNPTVPVRRVVA